ncbi:uncharacterized protein LOC114528122 [Dendronephthya gigantea]|uniref:uncharacterized protein LOC114528122 n=1 Tax=Dendronephthya gigantea TaxID=151771 RepID=UPI00106C0DAF|nr:uncharacterized protein LOC114528122 [Dendronephthya gigantea]
MEETKVNKGPQGNNRRFVNKNRRDPKSINHHHDNSQGGKVNSVKPRYSSLDHTKHLDMKPEMVVIKQDNKSDNKINFKGKDSSFHGGKDDHVQHTQKEHRSNMKYEDRRKYNYPKERQNTRNFKPRNQSRGNEVPTNDETKLQKGPLKNESVLLKRNENTNMTSTPQHLKPAVHVQPLQQVPEKANTHSTVEQNPNNIQTYDSSIQVTTEDSALECQELSNDDYVKETSTEQCPQHSAPFEQTSFTMVPTTPKQYSKESKQPVQKPGLLDQNPSNPIFQNENFSLAGLATSGIGSYLSSSICSSFVPQKNLAEPIKNASTNQSMLQGGDLTSKHLVVAQPNHLPKTFLPDENLLLLTDRSENTRLRGNMKEPLDDHQNSYPMPREQPEEAAVPVQAMSDEKYGYRISVDSLFSTSFFTNPQSDVKKKEEIRDPQRDSHMVTNRTSQETTIPPQSQERHGQVLDNKQRFEVTSSNKMMTNTSLGNHMVKNHDTPALDRMLNAKQFNVVSSPETANPSLFVYHPLTAQDKKNENSNLVSPLSSKDGNKPTLGSPPHVVRNLAPRVNLGNAPVLLKDESLSLGSVNPRKYRGFLDQTENVADEKPPTGAMSSLYRRADGREDGSMDTRNLKADMAPEKVEKNISRLSHSLEEPVSKCSLAQTNSDIQTDSLVNLNYREIPKHSMDLPSNCSAADETKEPIVITSCPTTNEKTSLLTKGGLQTATNEKEDYKKLSDPPSLTGDIESNHVPGGPFHQGPIFPNPFLGHSLLTHRQAIPSAFVYPSRVGIPGSHSGFTDVARHTGTNPSPHVFPPHGTTVCLNVGGRIFEILPSTFSLYPESLLCQIFTGGTPATISQRGHIFFDRDGYLFEIILAFARVGYLTVPANVNLTSLMNEAKFFGMYEYMFQKGQISSGNTLQFQRKTRCTLHCDDSGKTKDTRAFVLQGDDKLKIESLHVSGPCYLYVDLCTPSGVKETSNFVIYNPDKPDLWKAYQFCAERQLVFHLEHAYQDNPVKGCNKASVDIVFAQTFVFAGDEFTS